MIWLNGALLDPGAARIDTADRGFLLGDGVFETIRVRERAPCHLGRHLARLRMGAGMLGIALPWGDGDIAAAGEAVLQVSPLVDSVLRLTVSRGPGARGVLPPADHRPTLLIASAPLPPQAARARLITATVTRRNECSPLSRIKSLNYLDSILARQEADALGADDAILLNTAGGVAEASAATLLLLLDGRLVTPPIRDGALPGIARALVIEAGLADERGLGPRELRACRSALLVNSLGLREVVSIDGRRLEGADQALVARLRSAIGWSSP